MSLQELAKRRDIRINRKIKEAKEEEERQRKIARQREKEQMRNKILKR